MVILTGKRTSLAPLAAASWILLRAWAMFLSLSGVTVIWHNAIRNYTPFINKNKKKRKKAQIFNEREREICLVNRGRGQRKSRRGPCLFGQGGGGGSHHPYTPTATATATAVEDLILMSQILLIIGV